MEVKDDRKSIVTDEPSLVVMFKKGKKREILFSCMEGGNRKEKHVLLWAGREEGKASSAPFRTNLCKLLEMVQSSLKGRIVFIHQKWFSLHVINALFLP